MMHDRRTASSSLSANVIQYLCDRGHTQRDIAKMLHVSEAFVSVVKSRDRSLTIDHLELLASALSVPLGALLIEVTKPSKPLPKDRQELVDLCSRILLKCDDAQAAIMRSPKASSSRKSA